MTDDDPAAAAGPGPAAARAPGRLTLGQHAWAFLRELAGVVVGAVVVAALLRAFVGQMFLIPSASMELTLQDQDRVVVEKISRTQRGEVVVFSDPGGWLSGPAPVERGRVGRALEFVGVLPDIGTDHLIKRVVGLPGDHVVCCDAQDRITVNDVALDERSYLYTAPDGLQARPSTVRFDVVVPAGRIFVLGDNREHSRDSRCHLNDPATATLDVGGNAFVAEDLVVGRAVALAWPVGRARWLSVADTFEAVGAATEAPATPTIDAGPEATC